LPVKSWSRTLIFMEAGTIRVTVEGKFNLPLNQLTGIQGNLKHFASIEKKAKCRRTLIKDGISFVFHVWKELAEVDGKAVIRWRIIDGHGRQKVLKELEEEGWEVPEVPCAEIIADSYETAKLLVLNSSSEYHSVTQEGLVDFLSDIDPLHVEAVNVHIANIDIANIDIVDQVNQHFVQGHLRNNPTATETEGEDEGIEQ